MEIDVAEIPLRAGFTGKEQDPETSLYYFGARYYDSWRGQWLSVDPLANKYPGWSPYNYVRDNPIGFVDPNGSQQKPSWWDKIGTSSNSLKLPPLGLVRGSEANSARASLDMAAGNMQKIQRTGTVAGGVDLAENSLKNIGKVTSSTTAGQVVEDIAAKGEVLGHVSLLISATTIVLNPKLSPAMKTVELVNDAIGYAGPEGFAVSLANDAIIEQNKAAQEYARTHITIGSEATSVSVRRPQ